MQRLGGPCRIEAADGARGWPEVNGGLCYTDRVQGDCGKTLQEYYDTKHKHSRQWRAFILAGAHSVNGQVERDPKARIPPNSMLEYRRPGWEEPPAPAFLDILWWDRHLVAVHKPSGLQVLPAGPIHERCALTLLRRFYQQHADELEGMPAPSHRLGRGTSGVLICACSDAARSRLSRDFAEHGGVNEGCMRKVYRTLVAGLVAEDEGEISTAIGRVEYGVRGGLFAAVPDGTPGAKPSRSHYRVLRRDPAAGTSLVDVEIFTGRPHQIRIHMAALGHPLVGDPLYAPGGLPLPVVGHAPAAASTSAGSGMPSCEAEVAEAAGAAEGGAAGAAVEAAALTAAAAAAATAAAAAAEDQAPAMPERPEREPGVAMPGDCGYLLHSRVLEFDHPITGERVLATCLPPPALQLPEEREGGGGA